MMMAWVVGFLKV